MSKTLTTAVGATAMLALLGLPDTSASAAAVSEGDPAARQRPADVSVTIRADGVDLSGRVTSTRPLRCAANRTVNVYKLIDGMPHLWSSDTTQLQRGSYVWSIGNTGQAGRFYASIAGTGSCRADRSATIRVRRAN